MPISRPINDIQATVMQNSGSVELHIHPHAAEETKIIHQEFNFPPIFGLLTEIN